jgi:tRNA modification GTPase
LLELRNDIKNIIKDAKIGRIIKDGIKVAIVGKPNVGKSSLLNALLQEEKAIVTNIAGTTRDIVEGQVNIDGLKLNLLDTAGIRNSEDSVEKIGIEKSIKSIEEADLILLVLDASRGIDEEDIKLMDITKNKKAITVINKIELNENCTLPGVKISAKNNDISQLKEEIKNIIGYKYNYANKPLITNSRQIGLLESSLKNIDCGLKEIEKGVPVDLVSIDLTKALLDIEDILGNRSKVNLSEEIFSRFCLGK